MKKITLLLTAIFSIALVNNNYSQVFWTDSFDTTAPTSGVRSAPNHANTTDGSSTGLCGSGDYFFRTNLAVDGTNGLTQSFSGFSGSYWRGEDLDGCFGNPDIINFTGIDITGRTGLVFKGLFGANSSTVFESTDNLIIEYSIDGGAFVKGLAFESNLSVLGNNGTLGEDANLDGTVDGPLLSTALTQYGFSIAGTGTTLSLRLTASSNSGNEEFAFDTFTVESTVVSVGNWTGATNTDWGTATNWSASTLPTATDNVVIPNVTNKPIISSSTGAVANNITIDASSSVTVQGGGSLIIDGTATVNGDFIYNVNTGDDKWHLVSSPVVGEQYDDAWNTANNISTNLPNEAVAYYINTSDANGDWVYYQNGGAATTFGPGIGYSLKSNGVGNYAFTGTFPVAPINPAISANDIGTPATENRWTLVGNPFPAYINIATFLAANATPLTDTHESVYVWNANAGASGEYQELTTGQIHPGQAFFVNSNVASTSVTFTAAMQSHQTGVTFYRTSNPQIIVTIDDGTNTKSTEVNYLANKTIGLDPGFDIGTFTGQSSSFNVYTHLVNNSEGVNFMRQSLPDDNYENMVIPIGVSAAIDKEITFTADDLNLPTDIKVFIEDRETNTFTRLDEANSNYKITTTEALNGIGRFYLHSSRNSLTIKDVALENVSVYKTDASTLRIVGLQNSETSVKIFNILGKQVFNTSFTSNGIKEISLPKLTTGVYVVQLQSDLGKLSKKIILE